MKMIKKNIHSEKGFIWILIAVVVMVIILIIAIVFAAAMIGSRTGLGGGSGGKTNPDGTTAAPVVPVDGACPNVQTMQQHVSGWCGVASSAQNIAFWQGNYSHYASKAYMEPWDSKLSVSRLNSDSGKSYHYTDSVQDVVNTLKSGKPAIAYTALYGKQHIIALTCFDNATQTFTANDSEPKTRGGQQSVQRISGVDLTVSNLTGRYSGHGPYPNHPMFLIPN